MENIEKVEVKKEPVIGEFKPKRKFLCFVSASGRVRVRFIRESAFIKGSLLSGTLDGLKFKITICDEGTINFEEIDTNITDKAQRQRLLDDIDTTDVTGYAQKFVVSGLEFTDVDGMRCYLEVEHQKPIDKLRSIFDEPKTEEKTEVSKKSLSILDQLFGSSDEEEVVEIASEQPPIEEEKKETTSYLEESFRKMNQEKINELKERIVIKESDIKKCQVELKNSEIKLAEDTKQLRVLENRLESMTIDKDNPNGYIFYVSEEKKSDIELDDVSKNIAGKISDLIGLKKDALIKALTESFYTIKVSKKDDFKNNEFIIDKEILEKIASIDVVAKITMKASDEFEYRGDLNWHQLVQRMLNKGFEQEPEFDKMCLSNSYVSKEEEKNCDCGDDCKCKNGE